MPSEHPQIRYLLDEYPGWLADALTSDGVDTVALTAHRPQLRGLDDRAVLEAAVAEGRVVATEDVTTFRSAIAMIGPHVGLIFCHHARVPRTRPGLEPGYATPWCNWPRNLLSASANTRSSGGSPWRPTSEHRPPRRTRTTR